MKPARPPSRRGRGSTTREAPGRRKGRSSCTDRSSREESHRPEEARPSPSWPCAGRSNRIPAGSSGTCNGEHGRRLVRRRPKPRMPTPHSNPGRNRTRTPVTTGGGVHGTGALERDGPSGGDDSTVAGNSTGRLGTGADLSSPTERLRSTLRRISKKSNTSNKPPLSADCNARISRNPTKPPHPPRECPGPTRMSRRWNP